MKPLNLPQGTVRALITLMVIFAYLVFLGFSIYAKVMFGEVFEMPTYLLGIIGIVIGYYFGSRAKEEKEVAVETGTTQVIPESIKYEPPKLSDGEEVKSA